MKCACNSSGAVAERGDESKSGLFFLSGEGGREREREREGRATRLFIRSSSLKLPLCTLLFLFCFRFCSLIRAKFAKRESILFFLDAC